MPRPLAPHGTVAAYKRHLRLRDEVCEACRDAKRVARRGEYEAARASRRESMSAPDPVWSVSGERGQPQGDIADLEGIARTLSAAMLAMAEKSPDRVAPLARELRATLLAMGVGGEKPKELSLADQLAEARAARAARASG